MSYDVSASPAALLPLLRTSVERLHGAVATLTDDDVRAPSLLPGWTRAHVLTHIARSADSRTRLLTAARTARTALRRRPPTSACGPP
ncbi:maleylpyruvate isomerase N-terminal domain-containing protein [Streptomyces sp. NPDC002033]|uniref:maleylpyruvate isomerase N-terminal domain-containing protein n=1 Tax=unclassified Streptomyces TaxID=2593676 RepID=UPI00331B3B04